MSLPGRHEPKRLPVNGRSLATAARVAGRRTVAGTVARAPFPLRAPTTPMGVEPAPRPARTGADYDTAWARRYPARLTRVLLVEGLVRPTLELIATPAVHGLDRLEGLEGPVIFAANHHSHLDTPLLLATIPEPWRHRLVIGAAADYFFGNRVTAPLSALAIGAVPIERTKVSRRSADDAAALIDEGWSFLIFPEGGRSPDGWGQEFRGGAAYLSARCGVPVVPVHLAGTDQILPKGRNVPKPGSTTITFGRPLRPAEGDDSRRFAGRIETSIAQLADEAGSDWWRARQRSHAGRTPSLTGPDVGAWRRTWALGDRSAGRRRARRTWPKL